MLGRNRRTSESSGRGGLKSRSALVTGLVAVLTVALVLPLMAAAVNPTHIPGAAAQTCQELADEYGGGAIWHEVKVTRPDTTGTDGTLSVVVTYIDDRRFNWNVAEDTDSPAVDAVYVKSGSQGSNLYRYIPPVTSDDDLRVPRNQSISHILFCYTGDPVNTAPVAFNDSYSTAMNTALSVAAPGVLANDTDADGDSLTAILFSGVSHGSLTLNANGSFIYTPTKDFFGPDSFTYKANDGTTDSNVATVSIDVIRTLKCGVPMEFSGEGEPTYTVLAQDSTEECDKEIDYQTDLDDNGNQYVLLHATGGAVVFLERIEFLPQKADSSSQIGLTLHYLDDLEVLDFNLAVPAKLCKVDPREVDGSGNPLFALKAAYDEPGAEAALVLPSGETTCIISAQFVAEGVDGEGNQLVRATYYLYNEGDGFRIIK